ncbi:hypothetical protein AG1IA_07611 [Rhizoctonia solani AG-1 IA]|uniref:Uncharacterized protein n=1 Tax=Thanatephorus cucumeris (strain AG1-IA) TaxID=983506 RepID=L8WNL3_THACA|nr:hypothetical protein AG1IA_07611 [Rhizoctonia solani AG-1 IA]
MGLPRIDPSRRPERDIFAFTATRAAHSHRLLETVMALTLLIFMVVGLLPLADHHTVIGSSTADNRIIDPRRRDLRQVGNLHHRNSVGIPRLRLDDGEACDMLGELCVTGRLACAIWGVVVRASWDEESAQMELHVEGAKAAALTEGMQLDELVEMIMKLEHEMNVQVGSAQVRSVLSRVGTPGSAQLVVQAEPRSSSSSPSGSGSTSASASGSGSEGTRSDERGRRGTGLAGISCPAL